MRNAVLFVELFLASWSLLSAMADGAEPKIIPANPMNEVEWCLHLAEELGFDPQTETEVTLYSSRRVDYLNSEYAVEVDWATGLHGFEAIGQALYYAQVTNRKPAVLLLAKDVQATGVIDDVLIVTAAITPKVEVWAYDTRKREWLRVGRPPAAAEDHQDSDK